MLLRRASRSPDYLARPGKRLLHQCRIGDLLRDALREDVRVRAPRLERRLPARRRDVRVMESDRSPEDLELPPSPAKRERRKKPSREELDAAEEALEKAERKQRKAFGRIDEQIQKLERERRDLQRKHERERDELADEVERARSAYRRAMRDWEP